MIVLGLAGCSSGAGVSGASPSVTASTNALPVGEGRSVVVGSVAPCVPLSTIRDDDVTAKLPVGVTFPPDGRLLQVYVNAGQTTVVGESQMPIGPLQDFFRKQLQAAGHEIFAEDNEGVEAELFFALPDGGIGAVRQTMARCPKGATRFSVSSS